MIRRQHVERRFCVSRRFGAAVIHQSHARLHQAGFHRLVTLKAGEIAIHQRCRGTLVEAEFKAAPCPGQALCGREGLFPGQGREPAGDQIFAPGSFRRFDQFAEPLSSPGRLIKGDRRVQCLQRPRIMFRFQPMGAGVEQERVLRMCCDALG